MKGFYAPQTQSQNRALILNNECWLKWLRKLVSDETESCCLYCVKNDGF